MKDLKIHRITVWDEHMPQFEAMFPNIERKQITTLGIERRGDCTIYYLKDLTEEELLALELSPILVSKINSDTGYSYYR